MGKPQISRTQQAEQRIQQVSKQVAEFTVLITSQKDSIRDLANAVQQVLDKLNNGDITITIREGELAAKYRLEDYLQSLKDAPMKNLSMGGRVARNINEIMKTLGGVGTAIYLIYSVFQLMRTTN